MDGSFAVIGDQNFISSLFQVGSHKSHYVAVVVDNQDSFFSHTVNCGK
jgi:hypothetical protein